MEEVLWLLSYAQKFALFFFFGGREKRRNAIGVYTRLFKIERKFCLL